MYIPASYTQNTTTSANIDPNVEHQLCTTQNSCFLIAIVVLILIFYALALWDRYIQLRLREVEKDQIRQTRLITSESASLPNYGSTTHAFESNQYLTVPQNNRAFCGEKPPSNDRIKSAENDSSSSIQLLVPES
ncbi:hypothetical protein E1B28_012788 [Marasmius oreades]|uniref:Uncharacterized protein n=1 Tax=Marasmius oreades TaxID=181124 RepID=A0A9P7UP24_9AGAR|nr:uncharacterized protein E1B28_012788 [Marasmius oreades]KAG7088833.1 hypothetical protein E1B28_012788 [Marasmius oreades]